MSEKRWYIWELPITKKELHKTGLFDFLRNLVNFAEIEFDETYFCVGYSDSREIAYSSLGEDYYYVAFRCCLDEEGARAIENCARADSNLSLEFPDSDDM